MRPRPADYLQPGERVLVQERRHPLSVLDELLGLAVAWGVLVGAGWWLLRASGIALRPEVRGLLWMALASLTLGIAALALYRILRMLTSLYTVTDQRVYEAHGRLWFHLLQTTYDRITDLHVRQSPFGRMLGFGTVSLRTAGTGLPLAGVRDPFAMKVTVEQARTAFLAGLVRTPARGTPATARADAAQGMVEGAPAPPPAHAGPDASVWKGRPTPAWLATSLATTLPILVVGLALAANGGRRPEALVPAAFVMIFAVASFARSVVQYTTTRFEVRATGVVVTSGLVGRRRVETTYEKVTDLTTQQSLPGRLFGFGTIRVNTAGGQGAAVVFSGVADPERVKGLIGEARARRLGEA